MMNIFHSITPGSIGLTILATGLMTSLAGCGLATDQQGTGRRPDVTPGYGLLGELFQTEIVSIGMEELGYDVQEGKQLEYATLHVAVSNGDLDYAPVHWRSLHSDFFKRNGGTETMQRLGTFVPDCLQGYLVDKDTAEEFNITGLEQMQTPEIASRFDSDGDGRANLTGCNPGWGCELVIEHHLDAYDLQGTVEHDQGKYDALMADTITRYEQGNPIFYYTWTPYWVSSVLTPGQEVVWLEVPYTDLPEAQGDVTAEETTVRGKNLGFRTDRQQILANREFAEDQPVAARFMELVTISPDDINAQNLLMEEGEDSPQDIRGHAEEWVTEHREQFDQWLQQARLAEE